MDLIDQGKLFKIFEENIPPLFHLLRAYYNVKSIELSPKKDSLFFLKNSQGEIVNLYLPLDDSIERFSLYHSYLG